MEEQATAVMEEQAADAYGETWRSRQLPPWTRETAVTVVLELPHLSRPHLSQPHLSQSHLDQPHFSRSYNSRSFVFLELLPFSLLSSFLLRLYRVRFLDSIGRSITNNSDTPRVGLTSTKALFTRLSFSFLSFSKTWTNDYSI